jgi:hypothetical protein
MPLYGGIDLHANNKVVVLLDEQDQMVYQQRFSKAHAALHFIADCSGGAARPGWGRDNAVCFANP